MNAPRLTLCLSLAIALLAAPDWSPVRLDAATMMRQTITSRPTRAAAGNFDNLTNAYDTSVTSASGKALSQICLRDCTNGISATGSWDTFESIGSYVPKRVEIQWSARSIATGVYQNNESYVRAYVALFRGSQGVAETHTWETATQPVCPSPSDQSIACPDHVTTFNLDPNDDVSSLIVDANLVVQMTTCSSCQYGNSNISGNISVYDIRLIAEPSAPEAFNDSLFVSPALPPTPSQKMRRLASMQPTRPERLIHSVAQRAPDTSQVGNLTASTCPLETLPTSTTAEAVTSNGDGVRSER